MFVSKIEKLIGIEVYATKSPGIGGVIRQSVEDFVVEEVLVDGSRAEVNHTMSCQALGSSLTKDRYLLCILVKRNWDNFQAIKVVSMHLGISIGQIQIAGIKDAKALTAQYITIENMPMEEIQKVKVKDINIRPLGYFHDKLSPYYLLGNNFHITIKGIGHPKSTIKKRITKTVRELAHIGGVPNFFGHQRFGTTRPITHLVGKSLVKKNFKKAAMLFLAKPSRYEHPESRRARKQLQTTQDFQQALKNFPKKLHYERLMLKHLAKKPNDYIGAFRRLPTKLQKLFPQAYQAYIFNKFLSRRIAEGIPLNRATVGDYIVNVERSGLSMPMMYRTACTETLKETNDAIKAGKMRLAIPLVGFKQHPSKGDQGEIEKQILEEEGISPKNFKIKCMPEISAKGELRIAITPLNKFSLDKILHDEIAPSKYIVQTSFILYRGSYATIVLRELMKPRSIIRSEF